MTMGLVPRGARAGFSLFHLLVYLGILSLLGSFASVAFWKTSNRVREHQRTAERAELLLRAGERWRNDIRASGGQVETEGRECRIGLGDQRIVWRWEGGAWSRQAAHENTPAIWARGVAELAVVPEERGTVRLWRLDATLAKARPAERRDLAFTFRSVPSPEVAR